MRNEICNALRKLEEEHDCRILFAAESGSRAWGFASPDSDYDIRAIYVKPRDWYLSMEDNPKDAIEAMLPNDLDISAWELRKALRQFAKGNLSLFEWFGSPIIYESDERFMAEIVPLLPDFFNPVKAVHHYLAIHDKAMSDMDEQGRIGIKKLFYALRGFFAAAWSADRKTMPPTEFNRMLIPELFPNEILELVMVLKRQKENAIEKQRIDMPEKITEYFQSQRISLEIQMKSDEKRTCNPDLLNRILRHFICGEAK